MDILNKYTIPYKEYKNGIHHFEFKIDSTLFAVFEDDEVSDAEVLADVEMSRQNTETRLKISLNGHITVACNRCLDPLTLPVDFSGEAKIEYSGSKESEDEYDVIYVSPEDEIIRMDEYFYESILLSLPSQKVHADIKDCNPKMLERFNIVTQEEFDTIIAQQQKMGENPQFEKLKALKKTLK